MLNHYLRQTPTPLPLQIFLTNCNPILQTLLHHLLHPPLPQRHSMMSIISSAVNSFQLNFKSAPINPWHPNTTLSSHTSNRYPSGRVVRKPAHHSDNWLYDLPLQVASTIHSCKYRKNANYGTDACDRTWCRHWQLMTRFYFSVNWTVH